MVVHAIGKTQKSKRVVSKLEKLGKTEDLKVIDSTISRISGIHEDIVDDKRKHLLEKCRSTISSCDRDISLIETERKRLTEPLLDQIIKIKIEVSKINKEYQEKKNELAKKCNHINKGYETEYLNFEENHKRLANNEVDKFITGKYGEFLQ